MNALEVYLSSCPIPEVEAMNLLQNYGVISDNCVMASDVHEADCQKAIDWLKAYQS